MLGLEPDSRLKPSRLETIRLCGPNAGSVGGREEMRYILRRLGFFVVTLWAALTVNFFLPRLMPGNPALSMMARFHGRLGGQALKAMEVAFGINTHEGLLAQYVAYLGNCFTGQFGRSLTFFPETVSQVVFQALPWTLGLVGITT